MLELRFFGGYQALRDEAEANFLNYDPTSPFSQSEQWFSNGAIEVKIFRQMFGTYSLCNYRCQIHGDLDALFELATMPKIS